MATNFVQPGIIVDMVNNEAAIIVSGDVLVNRAVCGVAISDIAVGDVGPCQIKGVFELPALTTDYWEPGSPLFWDDANNWLTDAAGALTMIGFSVALPNGTCKPLGAATGLVDLHPSTGGVGTAEPETTTTTA